jgi:hypothetical protein
MQSIDVLDKFPVDTIVRLPNHDIGKVTGHATYNVAFVGLRTSVEVTDQRTGKIMGEFDPRDLKIA